MILSIKDLNRYGNLLVKYRQNVNDTRHIFVYEFKGMYYAFCLYKGKKVDIIGNSCNKPLKGSKRKGKYFDEYYNSSLNLAYKR